MPSAAKRRRVPDAPALLPPLSSILPIVKPPSGHPTSQFGSADGDHATAHPSANRAALSSKLRDEAPAPSATKPEVRSRFVRRCRRSMLNLLRHPPNGPPVHRRSRSVWRVPANQFQPPPRITQRTLPPPQRRSQMPQFTDAGSREPLPSPLATNESDDSHTHVVADGDSLEKLAAPIPQRSPARQRNLRAESRHPLRSKPAADRRGAENSRPRNPRFDRRQSRLPGLPRGCKRPRSCDGRFGPDPLDAQQTLLPAATRAAHARSKPIERRHPAVLDVETPHGILFRRFVQGS